MKIKIETRSCDDGNGHDRYRCADHLAATRKENLAEAPERASAIHRIDGKQIINSLNQAENSNQREGAKKQNT